MGNKEKILTFFKTNGKFLVPIIVCTIAVLIAIMSLTAKYKSSMAAPTEVKVDVRNNIPKAVYYKGSSSNGTNQEGDLVFYYDAKTEEEWKKEAGDVDVYSIENKGRYDTAADVPWLKYHAEDILTTRFDDSMIEDETGNYRVESLQHWFEGCTKMTSFDVNVLKSDIIVNYNRTFYNCSSLQQLDLRQVTISNTYTNMDEMFYGCRSLTKIYVQPGTNWNKDGRQGNGMFEYCTKLEGGIGHKVSDTSLAKAKVDGENNSEGYFTKYVTISYGITPEGVTISGSTSFEVPQGKYIVNNANKTITFSKSDETYTATLNKTGYNINDCWTLDGQEVKIDDGENNIVDDSIVFNVITPKPNNYTISFADADGGIFNQPSSYTEWHEGVDIKYFDMGYGNLDFHPKSDTNPESYYDLYCDTSTGKTQNFCLYPTSKPTVSAHDMHMFMESEGSYTLNLEYELIPRGTDTSLSNAEDFTIYWGPYANMQRRESEILNGRGSSAKFFNGQVGTRQECHYPITKNGTSVSGEILQKTYSYADGTPYNGYLAFRIDPKQINYIIRIYKFSITDNNNSYTDTTATYDQNLPNIDLKRAPMSYKRGFLGWYDQRGVGNGIQYYRANGLPNPIAYKKPENVTLYAHWVDDYRRYPDTAIVPSADVGEDHTSNVLTSYNPKKDSELFEVTNTTFDAAYNTSWLSASNLTVNNNYYYHVSFYEDENLTKLIKTYDSGADNTMKIYLKPPRDTATGQWTWWNAPGYRSFTFNNTASTGIVDDTASLIDMRDGIPVINAKGTNLKVRYDCHMHINGAYLTKIYTNNLFVCPTSVLSGEQGYGVPPQQPQPS